MSGTEAAPAKFLPMQPEQTSREFLLDLLRLALNEQGCTVRAATTLGGCVFHFSVTVDSIEVATSLPNPGALH